MVAVDGVFYIVEMLNIIHPAIVGKEYTRRLNMNKMTDEERDDLYEIINTQKLEMVGCEYGIALGLGINIIFEQ